MVTFLSLMTCLSIATQEEHDTRLRAVLSKLDEAGATLKC